MLIERKETLMKPKPSCKEIAKIFLEVCSSQEQEQKPKKQQETIDRCIELSARIYSLFLEILKNNYELEVLSCSLEKIHPQEISFLIFVPLGCSVNLAVEQLLSVESGNEERQNLEKISTDQNTSVPFEDRNTRRRSPN
jgi:hypothetical protein